MGNPQSRDPVLFEKRDHIAYVTLNRPEVGNALNSEMAAILRAMWDEVREDANVRCVVITGAGARHFCTGADLANQTGVTRIEGPLRDEVHLSARQNGIWKPTICAVNGLAAGGGLHFVVDSDIVVAATHAEFMDTHVSVGFVGALENIGLAQRLPLGSALRMTLQGKNYRLPAARAHQLGLVDELVDAGDLMTAAEGIASDIAKNSPHAVSLSLQAVWASREQPYSQALEYGWALVRMHRQHPDYLEGPRAFREGREPRWADG